MLVSSSFLPPRESSRTFISIIYSPLTFESGTLNTSEPLLIMRRLGESKNYMSLSTDRKLSKALSYAGLIVLLTIAVILFNIPSTETYTREAHLYNTMIANGGCSWDTCPNLVTKVALEETNGLYPPQFYQKDTKDYWRAWCTYNSCK